MLKECSDRGCLNAGPEIYGLQVVSHLARSVTTVIIVARPESTPPVFAPALHRAIVQKSTGHDFRVGDLLNRAVHTDIDTREIVAHFSATITAG